MAWILKEKEFESVLALEGADRYMYCVKKVADQQRLWSLRDDEGWALADDDDGHQLVPIWPHERFAAECADGTWHGYRAVAIELDVWLERWIPGMERDQRRVVVFPAGQNKGVVVEPSRFGEDLREELKQYE